MKNFFKNIQAVVILVLVLVLVFFMGFGDACNPTPPSSNDTITIEIIKWDTLKIHDTTYVPKWKTKTEWDIIIEYDTIWKDVDSFAIVKDYLAKYFYSDSLDFDSLGYIIINDTIHKNKIFSREILSHLLYPTIEITKIPPPELKRAFYIGLEMGGTASQINYFGGKVLYKTKKEKMFGLGLGINQDMQPIILGGLYWPLKRK